MSDYCGRNCGLPVRPCELSFFEYMCIPCFVIGQHLVVQVYEGFIVVYAQSKLDKLLSN